MTTQIAHSLTLPGAYPTLAVHNGRIYLGTGVAGSPWTMREIELAADGLRVRREWTGGNNPSGPPQLLRGNSWCFCEMVDGGKWPEYEWAPSLDPAEPTGRHHWGGTLTWRDGHVMSFAPGMIQWDERTITGDVGSAAIAGPWLAFRDHTNTRLTRYGPNGHMTVLSVPEGVYSFAVAPDGLVWYQPVGGTIKGWSISGGTFDMAGDLPTWVGHAANWSCDYAHADEDGPRVARVLVTTGWHPPTGVYTFLSSDSHNGCLMLDRPSEPFARVLQLDDKHVVLATYNSLTQPVTTVIDLVDLTQPFQEDIPEPGIDPPVDPPDGGDMTEAQYLALVAKVNEAVEAAKSAQQSADEAAAFAQLAVERVTDAQVRIPYLGTGRLNPK